VTSWAISEVAEKSGLSAHTLRWYERIGLLDRVERGPDGHRRFSQTDLECVLLLNKLRTTRERVIQALTQQEECLRVLDRKIESYRRRLSEAQAGAEGAATECAPPSLVT
jgi:DNA-binding transcriptional MerR regulator